jgi:hypothetical protein
MAALKPASSVSFGARGSACRPGLAPRPALRQQRRATLARVTNVTEATFADEVLKASADALPGPPRQLVRAPWPPPHPRTAACDPAGRQDRAGRLLVQLVRPLQAGGAAHGLG